MGKLVIEVIHQVGQEGDHKKQLIWFYMKLVSKVVKSSKRSSTFQHDEYLSTM